MPPRCRAVLVLGLGLAGAAACYKPNIQEGGLRCAPGDVCPDGFKCADDHTCRKHELTCPATSPHLEPICTAMPGDDCDPICQSRCPCGRCTLNGQTVECMAPGGNKQTGDTCNADSDDCAPGNVCIRDCDKTTARCYRFCGNGVVKDESVCGGQACDQMVDAPDAGATPFLVCEPPMKTCNPVGTAADCGNAALACYVLSSGATGCDCKGTAQPGQPCDLYNSCIPGYRCVTLSGSNSGACFKACLLKGADCTAPSSCMKIVGDTYGYCSP